MICSLDVASARQKQMTCPKSGKITVAKSNGSTVVRCIVKDTRGKWVDFNKLPMTEKKKVIKATTNIKAKISIPAQQPKKTVVVINNYYYKNQKENTQPVVTARPQPAAIKTPSKVEMKETITRTGTVNQKQKPDVDFYDDDVVDRDDIDQDGYDDDDIGLKWWQKMSRFRGGYAGISYGFYYNLYSQNVTGYDNTRTANSDINNSFNRDQTAHALSLWAGYNFTIGENILIGVEVGVPMLAKFNIKPLDASSGWVYSGVYTQISPISFAKLRLGVIFLDRVMLYAVGGIEVAQMDFAGTNAGYTYSTMSSNTAYRVAPKGGFGLEYAVTNHIFLRLEYNFTYYLPESNRYTNGTTINAESIIGNMNHYGMIMLMYKF
jgi:opacity protein-like surface antigen